MQERTQRKVDQRKYSNNTNSHKNPKLKQQVYRTGSHILPRIPALHWSTSLLRHIRNKTSARIYNKVLAYK